MASTSTNPPPPPSSSSIHNLKYLINHGLRTLQVTTQHEVDLTTTLDMLENLMAVISHTININIESAKEDLRQLSLHFQELQTKLTKYNSMWNYLGHILTVIAGIALAPMGLSPVIQPLGQLFGTVRKERMMNPFEEKLKVVETNRSVIHSMIIKVVKMKEMVQALVSLVAKRDHDAEHQKMLLEELKKALVHSLAQLELVELEPEMANLMQLSLFTCGGKNK